MVNDTKSDTRRWTEEDIRNISVNIEKVLSNPPPGEEVVITGISGSFPNSRNVDEFGNNLYNKLELIQPISRWNCKHPEIPGRCGTIPDINYYDPGFFGIHRRQIDSLDPMLRILLEKTMEAIMDAGLHPSDLENIRTGVYIGISGTETCATWFSENLDPQNFAITGVERSMVAHRLSYFLKLKGPSHTVDTACSSALYAVEHAYRAIRLGEIDAAIVGGVQLCLHPAMTLHFARLGVLSKDGTCKPFDESGGGYSRSETIGTFILQKTKDAKRIYAQIIHVKSNSDGSKDEGITYPSGKAQKQLLNDFYQECHIDRNSLSFLETHGTGTIVGDFEECKVIDEVLAKHRTTPLLIGSVKSNTGHSEMASGITSIVKVLIGMETGMIPPNFYFTSPRKELKGITEGRIKVVSESTPFGEDSNGLVGVSNFGFGGANCHLLLRWNEKKKKTSRLPDDNIPRLITISGRTEEAVSSMLNESCKDKPDVEYITLLHNVYRKNFNNHLYRGYTIVSNSGEQARSVQYSPMIDNTSLYFAFGELYNWHEIGKSLMMFPTFADSIQRIQNYLSPKKIDIINVFNNNISNNNNYINVLGDIAVQIGIIDVLKLLELKPSCTFGFSFGELLAAYHDSVLTLEEATECAAALNESVNSFNKSYSAVNFFKNSENVNEKYDNLNGVDTILQMFKLALRSKDFVEIKERLIQDMRNKLKAKHYSVEYYLNAIIDNHPQNIDNIDAHSIILKIGSSSIGNDHNRIITLFNSESKNYVVEFLNSLGCLYEHGYSLQLSKLYPVRLPVSRGTRMISPLIKWKHDRKWFVPQYTFELDQYTKHRTRLVKIQPWDSEWTYAGDHVIDGRNLFPATGYLYLVWETLAIVKNVSLSLMHIVFENCKFIRATTLPKDGFVLFRITIQVSGEFEIIENDAPVVTGRIYETEENLLESKLWQPSDQIELSMNKKDIYKELRLRGYNYKNEFCAIEQFEPSTSKGYIKWNDNWVTFIDNMLQMKILQTDTRLLYIPTFITKITINAKEHLEWIDKEYRNAGTTPILPVVSSENGIISCGAIQVSGLIASSIPTKRNLGVPVLESNKFIPNITSLETDISVRVNTQIILENSLVYNFKAVEVVDDCTNKNVPYLLPIVNGVLEDQPMVKSFVKILSKIPLEVEITVEDKPLEEEMDCLLVIASNILSRPKVLKDALVSLKQNGFIISREPQNFNPHSIPADINFLTVHKTSTETLLLLQKVATKTQSKFIEIDTRDDFAWVPNVKEAIASPLYKEVILYSENDSTSGILGLVNCLRREPNGEKIRCLFVMDEAKHKETKDTFYTNQLKKNMAFNIYQMGQWGTYRHILLEKTITTESEHRIVNVSVRGDLSSLIWIEGPLHHDKSKTPETPLVYIYCVALNFRDVMMATGRINVDVSVKDRIQQECVEGLEFSGRDEKGNRIMGMVTSGALSTLILADKCLTFNVPDDWSMEDAATVPVVYGTVLYGLVIRADLQKGQSILIHSGTGGIGLAAIRVALHFNCEVFTTVGTKEKRDFLKKTFPQLEVCNIGNSHDTSFEQMICRRTNGRGVDVVLNSLAEEKLIASVRCLAEGGKFIEIGKYDMSKNNFLNVSLFQKSASFHGVMLDHLLNESSTIKTEVSRLINDGIKNGFIKPLNKTVFKSNEIEQAFRFMTTGKHMGKVLVQVRKPEDDISALPTVQKFPCCTRYYCDPEKTYIIVGGLGGFGLELADWLILRGARKLVLSSRKGLSTGYQKYRIRIWLSYGIIVKISTLNVTARDECKQLLKEASDLGPVDAVFNLAVVLADALFENQNQEMFTTSFGPKVLVTRYLDELTREICPELNTFVVFSSVSCGRGNAGQTNYGMANSICERICENRRKDGYPALAVQWGAVGDVGLVAEMQEGHTKLEIGGTLQQQISSCLKVLDRFLKENEAPIVSSVVVAQKRGGVGTSDNVIETIINILGLSDPKAVSLHSPLADLGLDSMTAVEIKQTLEREYDIFLSAKDIKTITLAGLKELQEEKLGYSPDKDQKEFVKFGIDVLFRLIGDESESCKPYMKLKTKTDGQVNVPEIFLFPSIEGFAKVFQPLANHLNAQAISVQYHDSNLKTIDDIVQQVMLIIESHLSKNKPFTFVSYSFGTLVALEVAHILENRGFTGRIISIDSAPLLMRRILSKLDIEINQTFETDLVCQGLSFFIPLEVISKNRENILKCESLEERMDHAIQIIKAKLHIKPEHLKSIVTGISNRLKSLIAYNPSYKKLKSNIILYKPTYAIIQDIPEDYGLSELTENPVDVNTFEGDHATIVENEKLAETLNEFINKGKLK